ncbi:MAG: 30S ribosomal protein S4 [Patescibacteria group bacterium]|nr:30S ribosomal protein S4 [Patescibacteria group bacterium]
MLLKAKEKKERALGVKLGLKAERCDSPKCAMIRRPYKPGVHGKSRRRKAASEYGQQLLEKQKIKVVYGLKELQLKKIVGEVMKKGQSSQQIIVSLERRLDNVVFKAGFAPSRIVARQLVSHGHIFVNNKKVNIPSYSVKAGEIISINSSSKALLIFKELPNIIKKHNAPEWIQLNEEKLEAKIKSLPSGVLDELLFDINSVVDYYSR